jgi:hypothetical protein
MQVKEAERIAGTLSKTSKMPGYSTGLPAIKCITGSKLANIAGTVCEGCYALKGMYRFPNVKQAQQRRLDALNHPQWVDAMVTLITSKCRKEPFFRWHDSGDLQSVEHLANIVKVVMRTPGVKHWLPTRENSIVEDYLTSFSSTDIPSNLVIRMSAHYVGSKLGYKSNLPTSTVHEVRGKPLDGIECRAYVRDGECGSCRACWSPKVSNVSYPKH